VDSLYPVPEANVDPLKSSFKLSL